MAPIANKTGNRYGRLVVVGFIGVKNRRSLWECRCDCGNFVTKEGHRLLRDNVHSCGCYMQEKFSPVHAITRKKIKRIKKIWSSMKDRCYNKKLEAYQWYGARGISICDIWQNVDNFIEWAWLSGYEDDLTIDRIDNNAGYSPGNCRWASRKQQANNLRTNRPITAFGETKNLGEWIEDPRCKVSSPTLCKRLSSGMTPEDAIQVLPIPFGERRWGKTKTQCQ